MAVNSNNDQTASAEKSSSSLRQALPQILAVCVKNVLLLGFGMTLGFPTILIPSLSGDNPEEMSLGQEAISWIGSINLICVPVGCLFSGIITQPLGRKRAMQLVNIPFLLAWLLFHFSTEVWHIFLALAITGLAGGLLEAPVLTYVAEITQPHLRGMLSSTSTMSVYFGVLCQFLLGSFLTWRSVVLVNCAIPLLSVILLIFVPETPTWLITKNRYLDARKSLAWLRGWCDIKDIESEFQELCTQLQKTVISSPTEKHPILAKPSSRLENLKLFTKRNFLWPYFIVAFVFFLGHFNGSTPLQTFAIKLFKTTKAPIDQHLATIILGVVQFIGCIICIAFVNLLGKRVLNFISLIGSGLAFVIVATYAYMIDVKYLDSSNEPLNEFHWVPASFLILAAFFSYIGIKLLPWILTGEVYSTETRATASGLSGGIGYIFGFLSNKIFLNLITTFTLPGVFWFYGCTLTYVAEITTPTLRGTLASTSTVAVISGILTQFILGAFCNWRTVALISCIVPIISFMLLFCVPESPYWLISKERFPDAKKSLAWLRGFLKEVDVEQEFNEICKQNEETKVDKSVSQHMELYTKKNFLWPFAIVSLAFFLGHFSGMTTLQTYAVKIFSALNTPIDKFYATIFLGVAEVAGCILSACLVHYVGKRKMNFFSLIGCCVSFLIVATYAHLIDVQYFTNSPPVQESNNWIPITFLIAAAFFTHAGIRILPWMLIGEVYHSEIRATASGFSGAASYIFSFLSNKLFLTMVAHMTLPGTFWFYSAVCFVGVVLLYKFLPETERRTLYEITEHFNGGQTLDNRVIEKTKHVPRGSVNRAYCDDNNVESKL